MRLALAFGTSIALHAALLAVPSGRLFFFRADVSQQGPYSGRPSALAVELAPRTFSPPSVAISAATEPSALPKVASHLASDEAGPGGNSDIPDPGPLDQPPPERGLPHPDYLPPTELTRHAQALGPTVVLPSEVQHMPGSGKLILRALINERGGVDRVEVETSRLPSALEDAIVTKFLHMPFSPAERNGRPVKSQMLIEVLLAPPQPD